MEREKPVIVLNRMRLAHSAARPIRIVAPREYRPVMAAPFRKIPVLGPAKADFRRVGFIARRDYVLSRAINRGVIATVCVKSESLSRIRFSRMADATLHSATAS